MVFSEKEDLGKFSLSIVSLGFLMAQGDPKDKKAQKQIKKLSQALQKLDLEARVIENMRYFEDTCLSHEQKLKVYEVLLKTLSQVQRGRHMFQTQVCLQERTQSWRQKVELQRGAWTAFALLLGAVIASTETCEKWLHEYGRRLGVYIQMLDDLKRYKKNSTDLAVWMQSGCTQQVSKELCSVLQNLRNDLSEESLAYQFLNDFGLRWVENQEVSSH